MINEESMKKLTSTLLAFAVSSPVFAMSAAPAHALECESYTDVISTTSPQSMLIAASQVPAASMQTLWDIVTQSPRYSTPLLGKVIAADQKNSFAECTYPGIGLAVSSGGSPERRNVTFWLWASETNMTLARQSILVFINAVTPTTPTTTTTTTTTTTRSLIF